jgi:hypothetical protein
MPVDEKTSLENSLKQEPHMMARQALLKRLWKLIQRDQMNTTKALKSIKNNRSIASQSGVDFGQDSGRASDVQRAPSPTPRGPRP